MTGPSVPSPEPVDAEIVPPVGPSLLTPDYDEHGVPSLDYVRDRIEARFATSLGATELAEGSPPAVSLEQQQAERDRAAQARLEEIRRSLRG